MELEKKLTGKDISPTESLEARLKERLLADNALKEMDFARARRFWDDRHTRHSAGHRGGQRPN